MGGCGKWGVSLQSWPPSSVTLAVPSQAFSAPTPQWPREDREESGVPRLPPTTPGSAHMAKSHGFCPAHETHLTQNLFQLLQLCLAAVEASLSDVSASQPPPEEGEGAPTNNGALWHAPQRPPGRRAEAVQCPARLGLGNRGLAAKRPSHLLPAQAYVGPAELFNLLN